MKADPNDHNASTQPAFVKVYGKAAAVCNHGSDPAKQVLLPTKVKKSHATHAVRPNLKRVPAQMVQATKSTLAAKNGALFANVEQSDAATKPKAAKAAAATAAGKAKDTVVHLTSIVSKFFLIALRPIFWPITESLSLFRSSTCQGSSVPAHVYSSSFSFAGFQICVLLRCTC